MLRTVAEVLAQDYKGNKAAMSRAYGIHRNNVYLWIEADYKINEYGEVIKVMGTKLVFEDKNNGL